MLFVLILGATLAVRAALVAPIEQRANWIFRMTEDARARADQLQAAASTLWRVGVGVPIRPLGLTTGEKRDLEAFLTRLSGRIEEGR